MQGGSKGLLGSVGMAIRSDANGPGTIPAGARALLALGTAI
jgi:hypothetical protein